MSSSTPPCSTFSFCHPHPTHNLRCTFFYGFYLSSCSISKHCFVDTTQKSGRKKKLFFICKIAREKFYFLVAPNFPQQRTSNGVSVFFFSFTCCCCLLISVKINNKIYETVFVIVCQRHA